MRAMTFRADEHTFALLTAVTERLGIAKATFIREATIARIASLEANEGLAGEHLERLVRERVNEPCCRCTLACGALSCISPAVQADERA